jgi:hypothetical protein
MIEKVIGDTFFMDLLHTKESSEFLSWDAIFAVPDNESYRKSFERDLRGARDQSLLGRVKAVLIELKGAELGC